MENISFQIHLLYFQAAPESFFFPINLCQKKIQLTSEHDLRLH